MLPSPSASCNIQGLPLISGCSRDKSCQRIGPLPLHCPTSDATQLPPKQVSSPGAPVPDVACTLGLAAPQAWLSRANQAWQQAGIRGDAGGAGPGGVRAPGLGGAEVGGGGWGRRRDRRWPGAGCLFGPHSRLGASVVSNVVGNVNPWKRPFFNDSTTGLFVKKRGRRPTFLRGSLQAQREFGGYLHLNRCAVHRPTQWCRHHCVLTSTFGRAGPAHAPRPGAQSTVLYDV